MPIAAHTDIDAKAFANQLNNVQNEGRKKMLQRDYEGDANAAEITVLVEKLMKDIYEKLEEIEATTAKEATVKTLAKEKTMRELINLFKAQSANVQSESSDE